MQEITVAELFAGVGGFRLGLEGYSSEENPQFNRPAAGPFKTIWANQWEPPGTDAKQFAFRCYEERFDDGVCVNEDINVVLDECGAGKRDISNVMMVVGGFPCQDYSVAKPLLQAGGIDGKRASCGGKFTDSFVKKPKYVLLDNVDRLLKSLASQRGRDFAIMPSCFADLGHSVEWRVVNSAEYGALPQRRKCIYTYAELDAGKWDLQERMKGGVLAEALPISEPQDFVAPSISDDPHIAIQDFSV